MILKRVADDGFCNVVWINLREEAVIYVSGDPYTARRSAKLNENDLVPGITGHTVQVLELAMKRSLQEQLVKGEGHFEYWHEVGMYQNELVGMDAVMESQVQTLPEIYKLDEVVTADPRLLSVQYYRIPIERENAPEHSDVEKIMQLIHSSNDTTEGTRTAFVFNCQVNRIQMAAKAPSVDILYVSTDGKATYYDGNGLRNFDLAGDAIDCRRYLFSHEL